MSHVEKRNMTDEFVTSSFCRNTSGEKKGLFFQTTRRQRLQLMSTQSSQSNAHNTIEATPVSSLPGNTSSSSTQSKSTSSFVSKQTTKSSFFGGKSVFSDGSQKSVQLQPYIPKSKRTNNSQQNYQKPIVNGPNLPSVPLHKHYKPNIASWEQSYSSQPHQSTCDAENATGNSKSHDASQSNVLNKSDNEPVRITVSGHQTHSKHLEKNSMHSNVKELLKKDAKKNTALDCQTHSKHLEDNSMHTNIMKELLKKDAKKNTALDQVQQALIGKKTGECENQKCICVS